MDRVVKEKADKALQYAWHRLNETIMWQADLNGQMTDCPALGYGEFRDELVVTTETCCCAD